MGEDAARNAFLAAEEVACRIGLAGWLEAAPNLGTSEREAYSVGHFDGYDAATRAAAEREAQSVERVAEAMRIMDSLETYVRQGRADGAAQERARLEAWLRDADLWDAWFCRDAGDSKDEDVFDWAADRLGEEA